jgi:hypothetical protein
MKQQEAVDVRPWADWRRPCRLANWSSDMGCLASHIVVVAKEAELRTRDAKQRFRYRDWRP